MGLKNQIINKKLEDVVTKTVAAFANSQGGTLLIGVSDNGEILGLEGDYLSLGGANRDKFELHLRNLLTSSFGAAFVSSSLKIMFPAVRDIEICQVDIEPATIPLVYSLKDKNGLRQEKFYVRSGNSSQELSLAEMPSYLGVRFPKIIGTWARNQS